MMTDMNTPFLRAPALPHQGLPNTYIDSGWPAPHPPCGVPRLMAVCGVASMLWLSACAVAPTARYDPPPILAGQAPQGVAVAVAPAPAAPVAASPAYPQAVTPLYFYPERAQPEDHQDRDRYECYRWAVRESGFDPGMTTVRQPSPPLPVSSQGLRDGSGVVAGAATGAILGAVVSSPRQAGTNAVIGAIFGAALGGSAQESRAQAIERSQARQQQAAGAAAHAARLPLDNFRRAMSACMQGRGYRVA